MNRVSICVRSFGVSSRRKRQGQHSPLGFGLGTGRNTAIWVLFLSMFLCNYCWAEGIAVIVNRANPVDSLSLPQLARIYKGQQQYWPDGKQIVLVNRPADSAIRRVFYQEALESKPTQKFFLPGSPIPIRAIVQESSLAAIRFVSNMPEAIGYVYMSELGPGNVNPDIRIVRVIEIKDGYIQPGESPRSNKEN